MALEEEYEYLCKIIIKNQTINVRFFFLYLAFRCAYCNYFNSARKQKPVFRGDIVAHDPQSTTISQSHNEPTVTRTELSSESSDSTEGITCVLRLFINCQDFPC